MIGTLIESIQMNSGIIYNINNIIFIVVLFVDSYISDKTFEK